MKTLMKAALLLSVSLFFTQASLAAKGGNPDKPDPKVECTFQAVATDCAVQLKSAYETLASYEAAFKNERDFLALTCKVTAADVKISEDKAPDAELKLSDSKTKIEVLYTQGKIIDTDGNPDYDATFEMADAMEGARACAAGLMY